MRDLLTVQPPDQRLSGARRFSGVVMRTHGKFCEVDLDAGNVRVLATLRGILKRNRQPTDIVAVGDRVWMIDAEDGEARIEQVEPRTGVLARPARGSSRIEQVIVANPDQVAIVFALTNPKPSLGMLDRFLILAESVGLPALIIVNKMDLDDELETKSTMTGLLEFDSAYSMHFVSAETGEGIPRLREALDQKITVMAGPSGVGKSSLVNALDREQARPTQEISNSTGKGRHTTVGAELLKIGPSTYLADTPGMRALALGRLPESGLDQLFREFGKYLGGCFYSDCRHMGEPGCSIAKAVESGFIPAGRFSRYQNLIRQNE